jgi:CRISPR-associated endonuclease Csn1
MHLNQTLPKENQSYQYTNERVMNRFLTREMFQNELNDIWDFQKQFHTELTSDLKEKLIGDRIQFPEKKGAIFYQRPLKSQKFRVGRCLYEPNKTKCCISSLIYQDVWPTDGQIH